MPITIDFHFPGCPKISHIEYPAEARGLKRNGSRPVHAEVGGCPDGVEWHKLNSWFNKFLWPNLSLYGSATVKIPTDFLEHMSVPSLVEIITED